jgi:hypothetical protein
MSDEKGLPPSVKKEAPRLCRFCNFLVSRGDEHRELMGCHRKPVPGHHFCKPVCCCIQLGDVLAQRSFGTDFYGAGVTPRDGL